jgi:hypothetical protein
MRLRFSLKWLLLLFASFALVLTALFDSQTAVANRFIAEMVANDFRKLDTLSYRGMNLDNEIFEMTGRIYSLKDAVVSATIEPRSLLDVLKFQRRIDVIIWFQRKDDHPHQHYKIRVRLAAGISRLKVTEPFTTYPVSSIYE